MPEPHQSEGAHQFKKVDLTGVEKKLPQFRHLVRLPDARTRHQHKCLRSPHGDTQQKLEPHQSEGAHQFKKVDLTRVEKSCLNSGIQSGYQASVFQKSCIYSEQSETDLVCRKFTLVKTVRNKSDNIE